MVLRKVDGTRLGQCGLSDAVIERDAPSGRLRKGSPPKSTARKGALNGASIEAIA
jgi:hypothetical protein